MKTRDIKRWRDWEPAQLFILKDARRMRWIAEDMRRRGLTISGRISSSQPQVQSFPMRGSAPNLQQIPKPTSATARLILDMFREDHANVEVFKQALLKAFPTPKEEK